MPGAPKPGTIVDRGYRLQEQLGQGGMGTVYRAEHLTTGQSVALKLLSQRPFEEIVESSPETSDDTYHRLSLAREFQTLASLHHPNVIRVLTYGFDDDLGPYFTMELLSSPATILEAGIHLAEDAKVRLIAQLLRALAYIHRRGVIHRDIKPGNVLVVGGEVKLLDFGIAIESTHSANIAGTIDYMAPELMLGHAPGIKADLFAVGVVFHQLLTGQLPHRSDSMTAVLDRLLDEDSAHNTVTPDVMSLMESLPTRSNKARSHTIRDEVRPEDQDTHPEPDYAGGLAGAAGAPWASAEQQIWEPLGGIVTKLLVRNPDERYDSANAVLRALAESAVDGLPIETLATRESFLQSSVFIGREAELAKLAQGLTSATDRSDSAFLIGGESGVGKSRLLSELRTLALVHGYWVADGQSTSEGGFLFQEWLPLIRALCFRVDMTDIEASLFKGLVPDINELLGREIPDPPAVKPEAALARMADALVQILARLTKPLLLILEDLHWGRSESLTLLTQVLNATPGLPLFILGTYRSDESPNLPKTLPGFQLIPLQRLQRKDIERLSESMLGPVGRQPQLVDYLFRQTEGNVFFVVEIVRALAENAGELERIGHGELPEKVLTVGIGRIVERRLDQVPVQYRPLLEFSATFGRRLDLPVLESVFPHVPLRDFLLECANAAVLESQGSDWRFAHDKLREGILSRLDPAARQRLHLQAAEVLERLYAGPQRAPFAAALGHHYKEAGAPEQALSYYKQAGDSAMQIYAYEQARICYAAAIEQLEQLPETTERRRLLVDLLTKQVQCSVHSAPPDLNLQRVARARECLELVQSAGAAVREDRLRLARLDYYCARLYNYANKPAQAVPFFRASLPIAHEFQDQELTLISSVYLGFALASQGQMAKAIALLEPVPAPMERLFGRDIETMRAHLYLAIFLAAAGRYAVSLQLIAHVRPWVDEGQRGVYSGLFNMFCGLTMSMAGDWPAALELTDRAIQISSETREPLVQYFSLDFNAAAHSNLGNHEAAFLSRQRALEIRRNHGGGAMRDWFEAMEAELLFRAGKEKEALEEAEKVVGAYRSTGFMYSLVVAERVWGCAAARLGAEPDAVAAHFRTSAELGLQVGLIMETIETEVAWGRACRERGDDAEAHAHFQRATALMTDQMSSYARDRFMRVINPPPAADA